MDAKKRFYNSPLTGDYPRSQRGLQGGSKARNGPSEEQRIQPLLEQNFHIQDQGA